jgi:hypothetical protein
MLGRPVDEGARYRRKVSREGIKGRYQGKTSKEGSDAILQRKAMLKKCTSKEMHF